jgi:hypothetical protein
MNLKQRGVNWKETQLHVLFGTFNGAPVGYVEEKRRKPEKGIEGSRERFVLV